MLRYPSSLVHNPQPRNRAARTHNDKAFTIYTDDTATAYWSSTTGLESSRPRQHTTAATSNTNMYNTMAFPLPTMPPPAYTATATADRAPPSRNNTSNSSLPAPATQQRNNGTGNGNRSQQQITWWQKCTSLLYLLIMAAVFFLVVFGILAALKAVVGVEDEGSGEGGAEGGR